MQNRFKVSIDDERNLELVHVDSTVEFYEGILLGHVDLHHFMVHTIFEVLVPGHFTVKSLKEVQAEVLSSLHYYCCS